LLLTHFSNQNVRAPFEIVFAEVLHEIQISPNMLLKLNFQKQLLKIIFHEKFISEATSEAPSEVLLENCIAEVLLCP
jgi:hypothetical protein